MNFRCVWFWKRPQAVNTNVETDHSCVRTWYRYVLRAVTVIMVRSSSFIGIQFRCSKDFTHHAFLSICTSLNISIWIQYNRWNNGIGNDEIIYWEKKKLLEMHVYRIEMPISCYQGMPLDYYSKWNIIRSCFAITRKTSSTFLNEFCYFCVIFWGAQL